MASSLPRLPVALTIAGSDSGGGAGLQADLKTFTAVGVHGTSVTTCLTAQNPSQVLGIHATPVVFVRLQLKALFEELPPQAAKTGMLYSAGIIKEVALWWKSYPRVPLVVDPVMISTSGGRLLKPSAISALQDRLMPLAALVTPNLDEASYLLDQKIRSLDELRAAAQLAHRRWGCAVLLKGGHLKNAPEAVDVFYDGQEEMLLKAPFVRGVHTHGTGCTYSAAIAAFLAQGKTLREAVYRSKAIITVAIQKANRIGKHHALNPLAALSHSRGKSK